VASATIKVYVNVKEHIKIDVEVMNDI